MDKDVVLETPPESSSEGEEVENDPDITLSLSNVTDFCSESTSSGEANPREDEENEDIKIPDEDLQYEISDDDFESCKEAGIIQDTIQQITEKDGLSYLNLVSDKRILVISSSKGIKSEGQKVEFINDSWIEEESKGVMYLVEPKIRFLNE